MDYDIKKVVKLDHSLAHSVCQLCVLDFQWVADCQVFILLRTSIHYAWETLVDKLSCCCPIFIVWWSVDHQSSFLHHPMQCCHLWEPVLSYFRPRGLLIVWLGVALVCPGFRCRYIGCWPGRWRMAGVDCTKGLLHWLDNSPPQSNYNMLDCFRDYEIYIRILNGIFLAWPK